MVYTVYGLNLRSDLQLPGMPSAAGASSDIAFTLEPFTRSISRAPAPGESWWYQSDWIDESTGEPGLTIDRSAIDGAFRIRYSDGIEFLVDADGRHIRGCAPSEAGLADLVCYLTGPVLGFILRLRGVVALHASAIEVRGTAILLVGDACAGKSTTAAALAMRGFKVITEDVAALATDGDSFLVRGGCAEIALRPDAAAAMCGSCDALPAFSETWDKRRLDLLDLDAFSRGPVPLGAVYMLTNTKGIPNAPCITPLPARTAMLELLANVYGNRLFHEELRLRELDAVHRIAASVPVRVAATGAERRFIGRFCDTLLEDCFS